MHASEVICVDHVPASDYRQMIGECLRYALQSKPFTIARVGGLSLEERVLNIFKGKLAESLFRWYARQHIKNADWDTCTTPFYQTDNRDFIWNGVEWDIKNNFLYHDGERLDGYEYTQLPALVPNRHPADQWGKRSAIKNPELAGEAGFIFTFLKGASLDGGKRFYEFCNLHLTHAQHHWLQELEEQYGGLPVEEPPYEEAWFRSEMQKRGALDVLFIRYFPRLYITGYALPQHEGLFRDTGPGDTQHNWMDWQPGGWYQKTGKGSCNFLNGTLWTTITNATVPVEMLPSFQSLMVASG